MSHRVGNLLGLTEYAAAAMMNRPTDPAKLAAEIRRLNRGGLKAQDISVALRVPFDQVVNALADGPGGSA